MGLNKGKTNNPSGRPKGVPNKVTSDLRKWITVFLENEREQILRDWKKLNPNQRIALWERLLRYSLPQLSSVNVKTDLNELTDEELDQIIDKLVQKDQDD